VRSLVFDAGPVISLTMNSLLWLVEPLKERFKGEFFIPVPVKAEIVDRPLGIRRFEFEALQVQEKIDCGFLKVIDDEKVSALADELLGIANSCFSAKGSDIRIVHQGEMSVLASVIALGSDAAVIDERTTRDLIEEPLHIAQHMQEHLHTKVRVNEGSLELLSKKIRNIKVIRSVELVAVAFELGLLDRYIERCKKPLPEMRKHLLHSVLWGVKLDGCAVSGEEIEEILAAVPVR